MKLPIELINHSTSEGDARLIAVRGALQNAVSDLISLSKLTKDDLNLSSSFNLQSVSTINQFFLDVMTRLNRILRDVDALRYEFDTFSPPELEQLIPNRYSVFGSIDVDALRDAVGHLEIMRYEIINAINALIVHRLDLNRRAEFALINVQQLAEEVTTDTHKLNAIQYAMAALNPFDMSDIADALEDVSTELEIMVQQAMDDLNSTEASDYHEQLIDLIETFFSQLDSKLANLEILYARLYAKYEVLYKQLNTLKEKSLKLYVDIINGAYIRSGRFIRVFSTDNVGAMTVSAWRPNISACPTWEPEYIMGDIKVSQAPSICDTDEVGTASPSPTTPSPGTTKKPTGPTTPVPTKPTSPLAMFNDTCAPNFEYWTAAESHHQYVSLLRDGTTPLNPNNASDLARGTAFFADNYGVDLASTKNFLYGISFSMKFLGYNNLVIGSSNFTTHTSYLNTVDNFHKCLYAFYQRLKTDRDSMASLFGSWDEFNNHLSANSIAMTAIQKFCVFLTYHWQTYVTATSDFTFLTTSSSMLDALAKVMKPTDHACQRISFAEQQASTSLMAFAQTHLTHNIRLVKVETDSKIFDSTAQSPVLYGKGQMRVILGVASDGSQTVTGGASWRIEKPGVTDPTIATAIPVGAAHNMMYVAIHEAAHTVDFAKGKETGGMMGFSDSSLWTNIGGWTRVGENWRLPSNLTYPSDALTAANEPPVTMYGHSTPGEDFAEAWAAFVLAPEVLKKWWPKRYAFFNSHVVPFMTAAIRR